MAPGVCAVSFRAFLRSSDLLRFRLTPTIIPSSALLAARSRPNYRAKGRSYCTEAKPPQASVPLLYDATDEITVKYIQGLPHITVPLPSRCEKCRFALMPVSHKVYNLVEMLKLEDRGVDRVVILNEEGIRIASTCSIESLMDEPFWLCINDKKYKVVPPQRKRVTSEDLSKLGDVKALVGQLYEALHVGEYHVNREQELVMKLEELQYQLTEMEDIQEKLNRDAIRRNNILAWAGLGYMAIQFGILARLTWWEYSWDIMEPVTYFVTYGTAMTVYAYYCVTKMEYNYDDVKDRLYLLFVHKKAKKIRFDINAYNELKRQVYDIEYDLKRLRDPLNMQFAPNIAKGYSRKAPPYTAYTEAENKPKDDSDGSSSSGPPFHSSNLILTSKSITDRLSEVFSTNKRKKKDDE